jgi:hypothetical protein
MCADNEDAFARDYPRLHELRALTADPDSYTAYFHREFAQSIKNPGRARAWSSREQDLQALDGAAWEALKGKLRPHLIGLDKEGRGWQQLIEAMNEASAYRYLAQQLGCRDIHFVPETAEQTPDLEASTDGGLVLCETKTISESDDEIQARVEGKGVYSSNRLSEQFLAKLSATIAGATHQVNAYRAGEQAQRILFLVVNFDDALGEYAQEFYGQIDAHLATLKQDCQLVFFNRYTRFTSAITMKNAAIIND